MVEHNLAKVGVAGSSPVSRSRTAEGRKGGKTEGRKGRKDERTEGRKDGKDGIPLSIVYAEKLLLSKPYDH